jgi:hypoxanthine phosphoribosyltransferase
MRVLLESSQIASLVDQLAVWSSQRFEKRSVVLIGIMDGAIYLLADVSRRMMGLVSVCTIKASSYGEGMHSGELRIDSTMLPDVAGKSVLLLDEICETGRTLIGLAGMLRHRHCADLATAALLCKPGKSADGWRPDWVGFECPDQFVVGYGLDWAGEFRNLPHIACLEPGDECLGPRALAERWLARNPGE